MKLNLNNVKVQLTRGWQGLNHRERVMVSGLSGAVGVLSFYFVLINPLLVGTLRKQAELMQLKQQVQSAQQQVFAFEKSVTHTTQSLRASELTKVRTLNALPLFLDHIGQQQQQLGFTVLNVSMPNALPNAVEPSRSQFPLSPMMPPQRPGPGMPAPPQPPSPQVPQDPAANVVSTSQAPTTASPFKKIQVEVTLLATYAQMGQFLESLESLPILVSVSHMTIQRQDIEKPHSIKVLFQVISSAGES